MQLIRSEILEHLSRQSKQFAQINANLTKSLNVISLSRLYSQSRIGEITKRLNVSSESLIRLYAVANDYKKLEPEPEVKPKWETHRSSSNFWSPY